MAQETKIVSLTRKNKAYQTQVKSLKESYSKKSKEYNTAVGEISDWEGKHRSEAEGKAKVEIELIQMTSKADELSAQLKKQNDQVLEYEEQIKTLNTKIASLEKEALDAETKSDETKNQEKKDGKEETNSLV